jgi:hypothetical protein
VKEKPNRPEKTINSSDANKSGAKVTVGGPPVKSVKANPNRSTKASNSSGFTGADRSVAKRSTGLKVKP